MASRTAVEKHSTRLGVRGRRGDYSCHGLIPSFALLVRTARLGMLSEKANQCTRILLERGCERLSFGLAYRLQESRVGTLLRDREVSKRPRGEGYDATSDVEQSRLGRTELLRLACAEESGAFVRLTVRPIDEY